MDGTKTTGCRKYLDWALSPTGGEEPPTFLRNHLTDCESCARERELAESEGTGLGELFEEAASVEPPADFAPSLLSSLPTPAWRLRDPKCWILPATAIGGLLVASVSLLSPLPAGLAEHSAALALLRSPLETGGEIARILVRGARALSADSGTLSAATAPVVAILAGAAIFAAVRRLAPRPRAFAARRGR